jgi:thioredoxin-dependent peroxiredoxin
MLTALLMASLAASPAVGDVAPDFTVTDSAGNPHTLSKLVEKGPVVLAFFPKAFTSGCTQELKAYRDRFAELTDSKATLLAISTDNAETMERFRQELKAPYVFIPDEKAKLAGLYDVKMPLVNMAKRTTFVVGPKRKIVRVDAGSDAINPQGALDACTSKPASSLQ